MRKLFILLVLALILVNCSDSSTNYNEVELDKEFNIKVGDSAVFANQGLVIKFKSIEDDSRCPKGAVCVWEGNAAIVLELKNSIGDTLTAILNTSIEPEAVEFSSLTILLKNLTPYPIVDTVINPKDYKAALLITDKQD